jgi:hypothetical protein
MNYYKLLKKLVADREVVSQAIRSLQLSQKSRLPRRPVGNSRTSAAGKPVDRKKGVPIGLFFRKANAI